MSVAAQHSCGRKRFIPLISGGRIPSKGHHYALAIMVPWSSARHWEIPSCLHASTIGRWWKSCWRYLNINPYYHSQMLSTNPAYFLKVARRCTEQWNGKMCWFNSEVALRIRLCSKKVVVILICVAFTQIFFLDKLAYIFRRFLPVFSVLWRHGRSAGAVDVY